MENSDLGEGQVVFKSCSRGARILPKTPLPIARSPRMLPSIGICEPSCSGNSQTNKTPQVKFWSHYHSGHRDEDSVYLDRTSTNPGQENPVLNYHKCEEARSTTSVYGTPQTHRSPQVKFWSHYQSGPSDEDSVCLDRTSANPEQENPVRSLHKCEELKSMASLIDAEEQEITEYLDNNYEFLEQYVAERIPAEVVQRWLLNKAEQNDAASSPRDLSRERHKENARFHKEQAFMDLLKVLKEDPNENAVLYELVNYITSSVGVDAYKIYKLYPDHDDIVHYFPPPDVDPKTLFKADPKQVAIILDVARKGVCRRLSRADDTLNFPDTPFNFYNNSNKADSVMYQPILCKTGKTIYVIEMWRIQDRFRELDEEISSNFQVVGSLALHYCNMYLDKKRQRNLSDFLLDVVKAIFKEMISLDRLIKMMLEFAQRLVNADRASLFLVDFRNFELVSTVYDIKFDPGHERNMEKKEIRVPINTGIVGHVALSGKAMNIQDAYSDPRFNREIDEAKDYKTINILCLPIKAESSVIGVVQMTNKRDNKSFNRDDEVTFEIFSTFFGLALHHARLYDRIMRTEQKYRVALEVISYHNTCRETEVMTMLGDDKPLTVDLNNFYLDPFKFDEFEKCKLVINMFIDLFDLTNFDISTLTRFVLTVKKNYRRVPYHNFDHGWTVAHSMYVMLKNDYQKRFNYKMRLALFVACLCHDLDHRGYTNKYMCETASPLAAMYTTSTLEHHHFNITVTILQQDGHNIFAHIGSEDYKEILGMIRHCILATDLAILFPNLEKINRLIGDTLIGFNWAYNTHRDLAMAISMTAADLSAAAKPWDIQIKTVKVIFEEFYDQGDKERANGRMPIPMMDRHKPKDQPSTQVGFLSQICIPCYKALHQLLPNTIPMYAMAQKNLDRWKAIANKQGIKGGSSNTDDEQTTRYENIIINPLIHTTDNVRSMSDVDLKLITEDNTEVRYDPLATRSGWKNMGGEKWIDEEGLAITKEAVKRIVHKDMIISQKK